VRDAKARRGFTIIALCGVLAIYGAFKLVGYWLTTPSPDFGEAANAALPLAIGLAGIVGGFLTVFRNLG
jgi:hypothetical protein